MASNDNPLDRMGKPDRAFVGTERGPALDVLATTELRKDSLTPRISIGSLEADDVLEIAYETPSGTPSVEIPIKSVDYRSYGFDNDYLLLPEVIVDLPADMPQPPEGMAVYISGSTVLPGGSMMQPGNIVLGDYLSLTAGGREMSLGPLVDLKVKRETPTGFMEVPLNALDKQEASPEHQRLKSHFDRLFEAIKATGHDFDAPDSDGIGYANYFHKDRRMIIAGERQGFGCRPRSQYELYVHDRRDSTLLALKYFEKERLLQVALAPVARRSLEEAILGGHVGRWGLQQASEGLVTYNSSDTLRPLDGKIQLEPGELLFEDSPDSVTSVYPRIVFGRDGSMDIGTYPYTPNQAEVESFIRQAVKVQPLEGGFEVRIGERTLDVPVDPSASLETYVDRAIKKLS